MRSPRRWLLALMLAASLGFGARNSTVACPNSPPRIPHSAFRIPPSSNPQSAIRNPQFITTPTASAPDDSGNRLLRAAAERMARHTSVTCNLRHRVDLFGQQLAGSGSYWQMGTGDEMLLRLTLKAQIDKQVTSLLQVCDGRFLWLRRDMPERTTLGRVDLKRLRAALAAEAAPPVFDLAPITALGGLPKLLHGLEANFRFAPPQSGKYRDLQVWIVAGRWKPERLAKLLPAHKEAILAGRPAPLDKLAEHLPTGVALVVGRDDLFPYRLEYQRDDGAGQGSAKAIVTLELFEVRLDAPLDRLQFVYQPDNQDVVDLTELTLKRMTAAGAAKAE